MFRANAAAAAVEGAPALANSAAARVASEQAQAAVDQGQDALTRARAVADLDPANAELAMEVARADFQLQHFLVPEAKRLRTAATRAFNYIATCDALTRTWETRRDEAQALIDAHNPPPNP
jgi:hypothetical protein